MPAADPLKARIALLQMGEAQHKLKPEHQAELDAYRAKGLAPGAGQTGDAVTKRQAAGLLAKEQTAVDVAHRGLSAMDEFEAINNRIRPRGGVLNHIANTVSGWLGNADLDRINQLSKGFARTQRQPGEGATSDFEGKMYNMMVGGADRPYQANVDFLNAARRQAHDIIDRHQFRDNYASQHGTLLGADEAYERQKAAAPPSTRKPAAPPAGRGWSVVEAQ